MWKNKLFETAKDCVLIEKAPLSDYTTFRVGGPAEILAKPQTEEALCSLLDWVKSEAVPFLLIGNGSNLLVRDGGFDGLVIHIGNALGDVRMEGNCLIAQAGALLSKVATVAADNSLAGMAFAHGIPGSLGGAVYMNAGAYGGEIKDVAIATEFMDMEGNCHWIRGEEQGFSYRNSSFQGREGVIIRTVFLLRPGNEEEIRNTIYTLNEKRRASQPLDKPSAGSTFKRPATGYAAALIEQAGLKGLQVGGAAVSVKHAGFVVNLGDATAADVLELVEQVKLRVLEHSGIELEPEVRLWAAQEQS